MKNMHKILFLVFVSFLFFGCIDITYEQKFEKDGSSTLKQVMNLTAYALQYESASKSLGSYGSDASSSTSISPDTTFKESDYSSYGTPAANKLVVGIPASSYSTGLTANTQYGYAQVEITNNNNFEISDVSVSVKGYAFKDDPSGLDAAFFYVVPKGEKESASLYFSIADVPAGKYPIVLVIKYKDNNAVERTVAYKTQLDVKAKVGTTSSPSPSQPVDFDKLMQDSCANVTKKDPAVTCTYANKVMTLSKKVTQAEGKYEFKKESKFPDSVYSVKIDQLPEIVSGGSALGGTDSLGGGASQDPAKFTDPKSAASASALKLYGVKISYVVEMPGTISKAEGATTIEGNKATFDALERMTSGKTIEVESKQTDLGGVCPVSFVFLLLAGLMVLKSSRSS